MRPYEAVLIVDMIFTILARHRRTLPIHTSRVALPEKRLSMRNGAQRYHIHRPPSENLLVFLFSSLDSLSKFRTVLRPPQYCIALNLITVSYLLSCRFPLPTLVVHPSAFWFYHRRPKSTARPLAPIPLLFHRAWTTITLTHTLALPDFPPAIYRLQI